MDFDSLISFLFLIAFFVLPAIFKRIKGIRKKTASPGNTPEKPSIFDRINEKIQKFVRELEQQAKQQKQADNNQDSQWDELADDQEISQNFETFEPEDDYFQESETEISDTVIAETEKPVFHSVIEEPEQNITKQCIKESLMAKERLRQGSGSPCLIFKSNPLQNAMIWSEILGKPVGLRE